MLNALLSALHVLPHLIPRTCSCAGTVSPSGATGSLPADFNSLREVLEPVPMATKGQPYGDVFTM